MNIKQTQKYVNLLVCGVTILYLTGCASIITSGDRKISIHSTPDAASITIYDKNNNVVATGTTPTEIKLKKGDGYFKGADYRLVLAKAGCQTKELEIKHDINGWYFGNFVLGGFLGMLVVDPLTGGMWVLRPDHVDVQLAPAVGLNEAPFQILTPEDLTQAQRDRLVPVHAGLTAQP